MINDEYRSFIELSEAYSLFKEQNMGKFAREKNPQRRVFECWVLQRISGIYTRLDVIEQRIISQVETSARQ